MSQYEDYMERLESDLEPEIAEDLSLKACKAVAITTSREAEGLVFPAEAEIEQRLVITAKGHVQFRSFTYHGGSGHHGIGRALETDIPETSVREMMDILDAWLFSRSGQTWQKPDACGTWKILALHAGGGEDMQRGNLDGAFFAGLDISQFIKERVPVDGLYLFNQN